MLLSDVIERVRLDMFDTAASRWSDEDIQRAIERAVRRYSQVAPHITYTDIAAQPYQRVYGYPKSWHPNYPIHSIERICYPLQIPGSQYAAPLVGPSLATISQSSNLSAGTYRYRVTFLTQGGETNASPEASVSCTGNNQRIQLTNIPIVPQANIRAVNTVLGRVIYRSEANATSWQYLTTLHNNVSTSYTDSLADTQLISLFQPPAVNTSGIAHWPERARPFAQGIMPALPGQINDNASEHFVPSFILLVRENDVPRSGDDVIRVYYTTRQQLDNEGCTIPDIHIDDIVLGATAYAMEAYQVPTNDNFAFQNGALHERLDDTHIPRAWQATIRAKLQRFEERLREIKRERAEITSVRVRWTGI